MPGFLDDYEPVEDRLAKFWEEWPGGQINTDMLPAPEGQFIVRAQVWRSANVGVQSEGRPDATGLAQEFKTEKGVNSTSALENCETSAIGRALANLGYAAKGKRPSREEMAKTKAGGEPTVAEHVTWLREQTAIFKGWDENQLAAAYAIAMTNLAYESFDSMDKAKRLFDHMTGQYNERPIEGEDTK